MVPALFLSLKIIKRAHIIVLMSGKINIITGKFIYPFNCSASSTFIDPLFLKKTTIIAKPIAASAAATVKTNIVNICPVRLA